MDLARYALPSGIHDGVSVRMIRKQEPGSGFQQKRHIAFEPDRPGQKISRRNKNRSASLFFAGCNGSRKSIGAQGPSVRHRAKIQNIDKIRLIHSRFLLTIQTFQ